MLCYGYQEGIRSGINWETGTDIYTLLCVKWVTNESLLDGTGNSTRLRGDLHGKGIFQRGDIYSVFL